MARLRADLRVVVAGSAEVDRALGWQPGTLTPWLEQHGHLQPGQAKPARPTEAVEHAMDQKRQPPRWRQPWAHIRTKLAPCLGASMRTVNVHEAKTQFSRLIDAAHAGETILVAKDGKPWARLVPLETDRPRRQPGLLRGQLQLPPLDVLLDPLPPEEFDGLDAPLPP
jgi:prevent-host-death family protein